MTDQLADRLHYEMKIPPQRPTPDAGNDSDQSRIHDPQPGSRGKEDDADGSQVAKPHPKHP